MQATPYFLYRSRRDEQRLRRFLSRYAYRGGRRMPEDLRHVSAVFRWGAHPDSDAPLQGNATTRIFNTAAELERLRDLRLSEKRLTMHGQRAALTLSTPLSATHTNLYRIFVFGTEALTVYRGLQWFGAGSQERLRRKLCREAVRVVYALGLDFAEVSLRLEATRPVVTAIDPTPALDQETERMWAQAIEETLRSPATTDSQTSFLIGCDCEFLLCRDNGRVVSADRFLTRYGRVGCDGFRDRQRRMIYPLAELRTRPRSVGVALVKELRRALYYASTRIAMGELKWRAGGMPRPGFALGGHLHFSGIRLTTSLLRALDNYAALLFVLLEQKEERQRRPKYGFLGDFRHKPHGGFEYRTLPSWVVTPGIAAAVCALAEFIALHYPLLRQNPLSDLRLQQAYYDGHSAELLQPVRRLWEELQSLAPFRPYARYVSPLWERALSLRTWPSDEDIRKYWRIPPYGDQKSESTRDSGIKIVL